MTVEYTRAYTRTGFEQGRECTFSRIGTLTWGHGRRISSMDKDCTFMRMEISTRASSRKDSKRVGEFTSIGL